MKQTREMFSGAAFTAALATGYYGFTGTIETTVGTGVIALATTIAWATSTIVDETQKPTGDTE